MVFCRPLLFMTSAYAAATSPFFENLRSTWLGLGARARVRVRVRVRFRV